MVYLVLFFVVAIIFLFSSKKFSPIPYFPSQSVDIPLIIEALKLKKDQTVIDLGAGDGIVIFEAAKSSFQKEINTKFIAVEINPVLILILHIRRFFHPNKKNIKIIRDDIFSINYSHLIINNYQLTIYLYISPWFLEKTISNIKNQTCLSAGRYQRFSIISYMYPVKSMKKSERFIEGKNKIFAYN